MVFAGCALPAASCNTMQNWCADAHEHDHDALCWVLAHDQWAADAHDALCWLRPTGSQLQHWCR